MKKKTDEIHELMKRLKRCEDKGQIQKEEIELIEKLLSGMEYKENE